MPNISNSKPIYEIKSVELYIKNKIGDLAYSLVCVGFQNKNKKFLEDDLAKKTQIRVADIRSALNKLNYFGIVGYTKQKNNKTGWITYKWQFDKKKLAKLIINELEDRKEKIKENLKNVAEYEMYACSSFCKILPFEVAIEYNFRCPACNKMMDKINEKKYRENLENELIEIDAEIKALNKHSKR